MWTEPRMDKYEQLGVAGEGAYGVVLKCRQKETGKLVAVKKFKEPDEEDELAKKCTQREVKILQTLRHENIVQMMEVFRRKGILYLVFEYVEKSMMDLLDAHPNGLGGESVRRLSHQLTCALQHCHQHNVIHRDIKPENLLINPADESLRLCDFGSARQVIGTSKSPLTDYVATRWYRAPELLLSTDNYSKSVDMWGLACVAAELCDGKPLFAGESDLDQLSLIQKALGPLTKGQVARYMELSDFCSTKFPSASDPELLRRRLGKKAPGEQLQFLEGILRMDPSQRLTAAAALASAWFHGMQNGKAAATLQQPPPRKTVPLRRASRTPSPVDSVASELEEEIVEGEDERPATAASRGRPDSSRPCSGSAKATPRQLQAVSRGNPSSRSSPSSSFARVPSRSARNSPRGLQVLPPEVNSPARTPLPAQVSPSLSSRPASRSTVPGRPSSSSRSLALPRADKSRPPSSERQTGELRASSSRRETPSARPSPRHHMMPANASVSGHSQSMLHSAVDQSFSSSASSRPRRDAKQCSSSESLRCSSTGMQELSVGVASYEGASRSCAASPLCSARSASGGRQRRPASSGRPPSASYQNSATAGASGEAQMEEVPLPDGSFRSESAASMAEPPTVGIGGGAGRKTLEVPTRKNEDSEVSYTSIQDEGASKGRSATQQRSSCGESIQEEISTSHLAQVPEELDESHTTGPAACVQASAAEPHFGALAPGGRGLAVVPGSKLGLIQRKGARWKVT